jgi:hypothetical protein
MAVLPGGSAVGALFAVLAPVVLLVAALAAHRALATTPLVRFGSLLAARTALVAVLAPVMGVFAHGSASGAPFAVFGPIVRACLPAGLANATLPPMRLGSLLATCAALVAVLAPIMGLLASCSALGTSGAILAPVMAFVASLGALQALTALPSMKTESAFDLHEFLTPQCSSSCGLAVTAGCSMLWL